MQQSLIDTQKFKSKVIFALFTFGPLMLTFILPLIFFKHPLIATIFWYSIPANIVFIATAISISWFLFLFLTILFPRFSFKKATLEWPEKYLFSITLYFTVLAFLYNILTFFIKIPASLVVILLPIKIMSAIAVAIYIYLNKNKILYAKKTGYFILAVNILMICAHPLLSGNAYDTIYSLIAIAFAYTIIQKNWKKSLLVIFLTLFVIASAMIVKNYVRELKINPKHLVKYDYIIFEHLNSVNFPNTPILRYENYVLNRIFTRLDNFTEFAYVVNTTPDPIPYLYGKTYKTLLYVFIPRMLWHNKPVVEDGQFFAHRYHFITDNDHVSCWSIPLPTEAWINFGLPGIILSAIIIGLLINFFWSLFAAGEQIRNIIFATIIVFTASQGETNTTITIGSMIHALIFYWIVDIIVRHWPQRKSDL